MTSELTRQPLRREFAVKLERVGTDQRTLGGCCVPYNRAELVSDDGGQSTYYEQFAPGAFGRQVVEPRRIELRYRHGDGLLERIGITTQLEEREAGLWGVFRVFDGHVGDQALTLVDEELLRGFSVAGEALKSYRNSHGVVVRQRVHLDHVGLCETPAYSDALVSMRRTRVDMELPPPPSDEQLQRLAALGITPKGRDR